MILTSDEEARVQAIADHYGMTFSDTVRAVLIAGMKAAEDTAKLAQNVADGKTQIELLR